MASPASALTEKTYFHSAADGLEWAIKDYMKSGGELERVTMDRVLDQAEVPLQAKQMIAERFEILGTRGPIDPSTSARLFALNSYQIEESRRNSTGRYVIWLGEYGLQVGWESEDRIKALMLTAGVPLVTKGVLAQPGAWIPRLVRKLPGIHSWDTWAKWVTLASALAALVWAMRLRRLARG